MRTIEIKRLKDGKVFYSLSDVPETVRNEILSCSAGISGGTVYSREDECVYSWRKLV